MLLFTSSMWFFLAYTCMGSGSKIRLRAVNTILKSSQVRGGEIGRIRLTSVDGGRGGLVTIRTKRSRPRRSSYTRSDVRNACRLDSEKFVARMRLTAPIALSPSPFPRSGR